MDPNVLAHVLAAQQMQPQPPPVPFSPDEVALLEYMSALETQMIINGRMMAALNTGRGDQVREAMSPDEVAAFVGLWSEKVLHLCLRAGVTPGEFRVALRTGVLPDHGIIETLANMRGADVQ